MGSDEPLLATEEMLCRNALISGIPAALGMCSQLAGEGGASEGEGADVGDDAREDGGEEICGGAGAGT